MSPQRMRISIAHVGAVLLLAQSLVHTSALAEEIFTATPSVVSDEKAVFATVESRRVVPGRTRIGGTIAALAVKEGDHVELGEVIASVGDEKLALQMKSL